MPIDLPPQAVPAFEVQMVREVDGEWRARPTLFMGPLAQGTSESKAGAQYDHVLSVCTPVDLDPSSIGGGGAILPTERVRQFLSGLYKQPGYPLPDDTTLKVISGFKHGSIRALDEKEFGRFALQYVPHDLDKFLNSTKHGGIDQAVFEVTVDGKKIKLLYKILGDYAFSTENPAEGRARKAVCPFGVREIKRPDAAAG